MAMIKMLQEFTDTRDTVMDRTKLEETLEDLKREQSDLEYEKSLLRRE